MPPCPQVVQLAVPLNGVMPPSGISDVLGAVVGCEDDNRIIELAHVLEFLENVADIVVQLLHAGFVDAPVLAAGLADHGHILVRQHRGDVHARRVVPDEEWLVGLLGVVAIEEVDDRGEREFPRPPFSSRIQSERTLILAGLVCPTCRQTICTTGDIARRRS